jgi:hypothetical protein
MPDCRRCETQASDAWFILNFRIPTPTAIRANPQTSNTIHGATSTA